jgi:hypothetical protein
MLLAHNRRQAINEQPRRPPPGFLAAGGSGRADAEQVVEVDDADDLAGFDH